MLSRILRRAIAIIGFTCTILAGIFTLSSYHTRNAAGEVWKMLGITQQSGTEEIRNSFLNGYLSYYSARNARHIALNDRAAVAKDLLQYTKEYISSPAFKSQYDQLRNGAKPSVPEAKKVRTKEEIQKEEVSKMEKSVKEMEENIRTATPDVKKMLEPMLVGFKKTLAEYKDPNNQLFQLIADGDKYTIETDARQYSENLAKWEKSFPEDVRQFVKFRLQKMLDLTAGIDYNAALVEKYGKKRFVNPDFERKPTEWKQGFRAGKEVTEQSRNFVKQWLAELK